MVPPMTATPSGPEFVALAETILAQVGPYPHARLQLGHEPLPAPAGDKPGGARPAPVSTIVTSGPKPQGTRMIKAHCPGCGYTVRLTRKWLDVAAPACPNPDCGRQGQALES